MEAAYVCTALWVREYFGDPFQNMRNAVRDREASPGDGKGKTVKQNPKRILHK